MPNTNLRCDYQFTRDSTTQEVSENRHGMNIANHIIRVFLQQVDATSALAAK